MKSAHGDTVACCGLDLQGDRPQCYLEAHGPRGGPSRAGWSAAAGRAQRFCKEGFHYRGNPVERLDGVPRSVETAAAFALEEALGHGKVCGGMLALDQARDGVQDTCNQLRWHDRGSCTNCGMGGHFAAKCQHTDPPMMRGLKRALAEIRNDRTLRYRLDLRLRRKPYTKCKLPEKSLTRLPSCGKI